MVYLFFFLALLAAARAISGSWSKALVLPWVVTTAPFLAGAWLNNLRLMPGLISPWPLRTHAVMAAGVLALAVGGLTLRHSRTLFGPVRRDLPWNAKNVAVAFLSLLFLSLAANITEFALARTIPLFSADPDRARALVARYGYIHVFSVLPGHIIPIAAFVLATGEQLSGRMKWLLKAIIAAGLLLLSLWFSRGLLFFPILASAAVFFLIDRKLFTPRRALAMVLIFLFIIGGIKYLRGYVKHGAEFGTRQAQLFDSELSASLLVPAASLYLTAAMNYEILNEYVKMVPLTRPHSGGRILAGHVFSFLPGHQFTELEYQNTILRKNDYDATLTSTLFGIPYLEFGILGVVAAGLAVGLLYRITWLHLHRGSPFALFFYAYLISMTPLIPYTAIYIKTSFYWFIVSTLPVILFLLCRTKGFSLFYRRDTITISIQGGQVG